MLLNERVKRIALQSSLMTLAILSVYWIWAPILEPKPLRLNPVIDTYMKQPTIKRFSDTGQLQDMTHSLRWDHYIENAQIVILEPKLQMYASDGSVWTITAATGTGQFSQFGKLSGPIELDSNVVVQKINSDDSSNWQLTTDTLSFDPIKKQTFTDSKITIIGPGTRIDAIGLEADFLNKNIKLITDVKTTYATTKT